MLEDGDDVFYILAGEDSKSPLTVVVWTLHCHTLPVKSKIDEI